MDDEGVDEPLLLPRHPAIMAVLDRLMNPRGEHPSGNFGRWNFDGGGPGHQVCHFQVMNDGLRVIMRKRYTSILLFLSLDMAFYVSLSPSPGSRSSF